MKKPSRWTMLLISIRYHLVKNRLKFLVFVLTFVKKRVKAGHPLGVSLSMLINLTKGELQDVEESYRMVKT